MKKKQKIILLSALVFVLVLGHLIFVILYTTKPASDGISATVTNVIDRPNMAEDGYYGITAQDKEGRQYVIDATGYLNTPLSPESRGEACVNIPRVTVGDKISFNLPKSEDNDSNFHVCHEKNLTGYYYFTVE